MNGMHQEQHWVVNSESDSFTASHDFELPPTSTLAQITLCDYVERDDQSYVFLGFTSCVFLDVAGVPQTDVLAAPGSKTGNEVHAFGRNGLTRADFAISVASVQASYIVNFFFWDSVS
jgi:hypothetical protein